MKIRATHVRKLYFEYQDLTQINGEPMFSTLHNMTLQLNSNTFSVPCTLGSCAYGFIGIILSPVTYATLALVYLFIVPAPPELLNVANKTTQYQIAHLTVQHKTVAHMYQTYQLV